MKASMLFGGLVLASVNSNTLAPMWVVSLTSLQMELMSEANLKLVLDIKILQV